MRGLNGAPLDWRLLRMNVVPMRVASVGISAGLSTAHGGFDLAVPKADVGQHALIERAEFTNSAPPALRGG